jgi:hypothetical protein
MAVVGEAARFEDVRRKDGGLGGVAWSTPFKELKDVRLCNFGVVDRALLPIDPELGVLLRGLLGICTCAKGDVAWYEAPCAPDCKTIGEVGRGVAAAVLSESRLTLSEIDVPPLFVDTGTFVIPDCSGTATDSMLFSMAVTKIAVAAAAHSSGYEELLKPS